MPHTGLCQTNADPQGQVPHCGHSGCPQHGYPGRSPWREPRGVPVDRKSKGSHMGDFQGSPSVGSHRCSPKCVPPKLVSYRRPATGFSKGGSIKCCPKRRAPRVYNPGLDASECVPRTRSPWWNPGLAKGGSPGRSLTKVPMRVFPQGVPQGRNPNCSPLGMSHILVHQRKSTSAGLAVGPPKEVPPMLAPERRPTNGVPQRSSKGCSPRWFSQEGAPGRIPKCAPRSGSQGSLPGG